MRFSRVFILVTGMLLACVKSAHAAQSISGIVVDAATGIGVGGAQVQVVESGLKVRTDSTGHFTLTTSALKVVHLSVQHQGYQPATSLSLRPDQSSQQVTLALQRATQQLQTIAVTSTSRAQSLLQASTYSVTLNGEQLLRTGVVRVADALRSLPAVNNGITGDTGALGDDVNLNIRGIGIAETQATIDGHPIGYGFKGGYNYQLSPIFPYRNISVLYGSGGSDILGVDAIGGIINFQTLDPTQGQHVTATQGYGTFERLASSISGTGTSGNLGYAISYGASGLDGPFRNAAFYQPGASSDVSAPPGTVPFQRATYVDDASTTARAGLVKLQWDQPRTSVTYTGITQSYWENKTGNGDGDFLPYTTALARGDALLAVQGSGKCPSGQLSTGNAYPLNGQPAGCQTPAQYASFNSGWQGTGPAWHEFNLWYDDLEARQSVGSGQLRVDAFTTRYADDQWRENLPFKNVLGDTQKTTFGSVTTTGTSLSYEREAGSNDLEVGANSLNNAYIYTTIKTTSTSESDPYASVDSWFVRDVYQRPASPITVFSNLWLKHATLTNSGYIDGRISALDRFGPHDAFRVAYGATTTEPTADQMKQPFTTGALADGTLQGAGGGQTYVCGGLNSLGTGAPQLQSSLVPERGIDYEAAYAHNWRNGSTFSAQFYNVNVFNKLLSTIVPLDQMGTSFLPQSAIQNATAALDNVCGAGNYQLGVSQTLNVGTLRARGVDLSGRWRLTRQLAADYDWALTSAALTNSPPGVLASNLTSVPGSQLPHVPLHTFTGALDATPNEALDVRYVFYAVGANNTKAMPAYDYSDLIITYTPRGRGTLSCDISNLFNQYSGLAGYIGEGVPLPLNRYANAAGYAPLIGAAATELYSLPYRQIYFSYQYRF